MGNMTYDICIYKGVQRVMIFCDGKVVCVLDGRGADINIENLKKHIERVMRGYSQALSFANSGRPSGNYTPAKIENFEYKIQPTTYVSLLRYKNVDFAQINLTAFHKDLNLCIRVVYKIAQSYLRYLKSFVDGKDETGKKKKGK